LSWLRFNERVLELAEDESLPLLERVRFLAIFTSNLDEFFMVRVAGLKRRIAAGVAVRAASGLMPREGLDTIGRPARQRSERHARVFREQVKPARLEEGIQLLHWGDRSPEEVKACKKLFKERVYPVLTPLAVDPAHPFPYISGLSLNLAVRIRNSRTGREEFARIKVPPMLPRVVPVPGAEQAARSVPPEVLVGERPDAPFPGMEAPAAAPRRARAGRRAGRALRAARGADRRAPRRPLPRHGGARAPHVPPHAQRGHGHRGGRVGEPHPGPRGGAAAQALRPAHPPRDHGGHGRGDPRPAARGARHLGAGGLPPPRAARPARA